jgi:hypothetical protein
MSILTWLATSVARKEYRMAAQAKTTSFQGESDLGLQGDNANVSFIVMRAERD